MDPNKYVKNAKITANSRMETVKSLAILGLAIVGLAGLAHDLFKQDGWMKSGVSTLFDSSIGLLIIPFIIAAVWAFNHWTTSPDPTQRNKAGDIPLYLMMAVGLYYAIKLLSTGSL